MKPSHRNPFLRNIVQTATLSLCLGQAAHAIAFYWDGAAASAAWNTAANWSTASGAATPNPAAEPTASDDAFFNITTANNIAQTVTLNGNKNALSLTFNNAGTNLLRSDSGTTRTLTLGTGGITVNSGAGAVTIGTGSNGNVVSLGGSQTWLNNSSNSAVIYNSIGRSNGSVLNLSAGTSTFTATIHPLANSLVGPWAVTGSGTSLRYVTKNGSNVMGSYSAGTAAATAAALTDTAGTVNYDLADPSGTTPATVSANTIRFTGAAGTLAPGATAFTARGLMNAGTGKWTIGPNPITIGSTSELLVIANSQDTEISGAIQNNGSTASAVSYHGGGTLTLSGNNSFTNGLNIGAGKVVVNNAGALNSTAANVITFNGNSGTLALNGNDNLSIAGLNSVGTGTIVQANQIVENASASNVNLNIGGTATSSTFYGGLRDGSGGGSLGLTKVGTGTLTLAGVSTYTGSTSVNAGTLATSLATGLPGYDSAGKVIFNGGTIYLRTGDGTATGWSMAQVDTLVSQATKTSGFLALDTTTASVTRPTDWNLGALGLNKFGVNALTLSSANTYSGLTTVTNGVLTVQNASALGSTDAGTVVASGGRLELDGGVTITGEALTISGAGGANFFNGALNARSGVNQWTGGITIAANDSRSGAQAGASVEVSGPISSGGNAHSVTFRPADTTATVIVSGANTYVGPTTLTGGLVTASSLNSVVGGSASSSFGAPTTVPNGTITFGAAEGTGLLYTGSGETTDRVINLGGTTQSGRIDQSGSGLLKFTSAFTATGLGSKTLTLQGSTAGSGEIAGSIADQPTVGSTLLTTTFAAGATTITLNSVQGISVGAAISGTGIAASTTVSAVNAATRVVTLSTPATATGNAGNTITVTGLTNSTFVAKAGTGTWTLSGTNTYTGGTAVNAGTLKLDYASGNDTTKLADTSALTLAGGTLELAGGTHAEVVASTTLAAGTFSRLTGTPGGAVLQMNAITRNAGASIDFAAAGIATTDTLNNASGILGTWATVGGTDWAANSTNAADGSITAYSGYTDLDDDDLIADAPTTNVRINSNGGGGSMSLGAATTTVNSLLQNNATQAATIGLGSTNTLLTNAIMVGSNSKGLVVGSVADDGILMSTTAGGDLLLRNNSLTEPLTINAAIGNNTSASTLTKVGTGTVTLAGTNTYTGVTSVAEGTLKAGSSAAFGNTSALVMTGTSVLDLNGNDAAFTNLTATTANRSEEHTSELQSHHDLVCRLMLQTKKPTNLVT